MPRISARETEWGVAFTIGYEQGDYINGIAMPNIARRGGAWAWRVPVDDESYQSFNLTQDISRVLGAAPRTGLRRTREWTGDPRPANDIIEAIKRGEAHIDDYFHHPEAGSIQDGIAQTGQGRITDRTKEHLGESDAGIVMLRAIWSREMRRLVEGQPLKQWAIPPSMAGHEGLARAR
jgi:5,5'-dehydrodivanillate O-demethylase